MKKKEVHNDAFNNFNHLTNKNTNVNMNVQHSNNTVVFNKPPPVPSHMPQHNPYNPHNLNQMNKYSPHYAQYIGHQPRAQASARIRLGGVM